MYSAKQGRWLRAGVTDVVSSFRLQRDANFFTSIIELLARYSDVDIEEKLSVIDLPVLTYNLTSGAACRHTSTSLNYTGLNAPGHFSSHRG